VSLGPPLGAQRPHPGCCHLAIPSPVAVEARAASHGCASVIARTWNYPFCAGVALTPSCDRPPQFSPESLPCSRRAAEPRGGLCVQRSVAALASKPRAVVVSPRTDKQ